MAVILWRSYDTFEEGNHPPLYVVAYFVYATAQ